MIYISTHSIRGRAEYFAYDKKDQQPELFTLDYLYSLHAAFTTGDFRESVIQLKGKAKLYQPLFPFMIAVVSEVRHTLNQSVQDKLLQFYLDMSDQAKRDFNDLKMIYKLGGLHIPAVSKN